MQYSFEHVSKQVLKVTVRTLPCKDAPKASYVKQFFRFRRFDHDPMTGTVGSLIQKDESDTITVTLWRDTPLTAKEEEMIASAASKWWNEEGQMTHWQRKNAAATK